jgi:hypothetical protein
MELPMLRWNIFAFFCFHLPPLIHGYLPPITDFTSSLPRQAFATYFDGCNSEGCGCGVPPELLSDAVGQPVPYVALNVQNTPIDVAKLSRPIPQISPERGMYNNGENCGRWVEIIYRENCVGHGHDVHSSTPIVCGVNALAGNPFANYAKTPLSGTTIYAVVADSCQDNNYW